MRHALRVLGFTIVSLVVASSSQGKGPVATFVLGADSVLTEHGGAAFEAWVSERPGLVGAAVARLLDEAADLDDQGESEPAARKVELATLLAEAHAVAQGSDAGRRLVGEYRSWDRDDRALRRRAKELEALASVLSGESSFERAVVALERADSLYAAIGDTRSRAVVSGSLGVVHWRRGDYDAVEASYRQALRLRREIEDRILEGSTLNGLGSLNYAQGRLEEAESYYLQAIELRRRTGDLSGLATSLTYLGNVSMGLQDLVGAKQLLEEAGEALSRVGSPRQVIENRSSRASLLMYLGRFGQAAAVSREAIERCQETADCGAGALLWLNLATCERKLGDLREAESSLRRAEALLEEQPNRDWEIQWHLDASNLAVDLGEPDRALDHVTEGVRLAEELGNQTRLCDALVDASVVTRTLGSGARSLRAAGQALELAEQLGDPRRRRDALRVRASALLETGDLQGALDHFTQVRDESEETDQWAEVVESELGRGAALSKLERFEAARRALRRAIGLMGEQGLDANRWRAVLNLGDTFEESEPDSAAHYYDQALDLIETSRERLGSVGFRTGFHFADRGRAYEEVARFYAERHALDATAGWLGRAFLTAERAKAQGLLDLLERAVPPELLESRGEAVLDSLYQVDATTPAGTRTRDRLEQRLADIRSEIFASQAGAALAQREPVGLRELQSNLSAGTLLLQYAVGDQATLLWIVEPAAVRQVELSGREELRRRVKALRTGIAVPGIGDQALRAGAHALYQTLLQPAAEQLARADHVVIVPDDILFELPFEVLAREPLREGTDWGEQLWLARDIATLYAPSSSIYLHLLGDSEPASASRFDLDVLAAGDPDYGSIRPRPGDQALVLAALPQSRKEVEGIARLAGASRQAVFVGAQASEAELKKALGRRTPRILHLAAHGLVDPVETSRSCIALAPGGQEDGYLHSLEILSLPSQAPLVVLSACESALGRLERGEGVVGLTRSFLAAGSRGVVSSLWPVADASTASLMQEFYRRLWSGDSGRSAMEALQGARIALMDHEDWGHPYFWAPFVLMGSERVPW